MGATKTKIYSSAQIKLATLTKAFGHPARIAIMNYLIHKKKGSSLEMMDEIELSQPTLSQHLEELKKEGIIEGRMEGRFIIYKISYPNWRESKRLMMHFIGRIDDSAGA